MASGEFTGKLQPIDTRGIAEMIGQVKMDRERALREQLARQMLANQMARQTAPDMSPGGGLHEMLGSGVRNVTQTPGVMPGMPRGMYNLMFETDPFGAMNYAARQQETTPAAIADRNAQMFGSMIGASGQGLGAQAGLIGQERQQQFQREMKETGAPTGREARETIERRKAEDKLVREIQLEREKGMQKIMETQKYGEAKVEAEKVKRGEQVVSEKEMFNIDARAHQMASEEAPGDPTAYKNAYNKHKAQLIAQKANPKEWFETNKDAEFNKQYVPTGQWIPVRVGEVISAIQSIEKDMSDFQAWQYWQKLPQQKKDRVVQYMRTGK